MCGPGSIVPGAKLKCDATDTKSASNGIFTNRVFFRENSLSLTRDRTSPKNRAVLKTNVGRVDLTMSTGIVSVGMPALPPDVDLAGEIRMDLVNGRRRIGSSWGAAQ
jgi:hypothetical protein